MDEKQRCYLIDEIQRILGAVAYLLQTVTGKPLEDVIHDFALGSKTVISDLVHLGRGLSLEKTVKTFCAWPMARALGQELPPKKDGINYEYLFGRRVRRFLISRISKGRVEPCPDGAPRVPSRRVLVLANSVLALKDCMVEVPESFIAESFVDYKTTLSTPPLTEAESFVQWSVGVRKCEGRIDVCETEAETAAMVQRYRTVNDLIERSIRRTVDEVFWPVNPSRFLDDECIPSLSSSYEYGRAQGGAWQELLDEGGYSPLDSETDLIAMVFNPRVGVREIRGKYCQLEGKFLHCVRDDGGELVQEEAKARVVPITEPCKVRWVSIGEAKPYFRAKAWNRLVYTQMPKHPVFALTSRPLREEDVNLMIHEYLLSGDYKGATDTLDPRWSLLVLECITARIYKYATAINSVGDWQTRYEGLKSMLTDHSMVYRQKGCDDVVFQQKTGQLMGSFLSFPILCILNAAVNRAYLDASLTKPLAELPMLINGDDVMMSSDSDFSDWEPHVGLVGLKPSIGKNYVHRHVCCLNSEFYKRSEIGKPFTRIHPIRLSLIYGVTGRSECELFGRDRRAGDDTNYGTLGSKARLLMVGRSVEERELLLSAFIRECSEILKSTNRSWWTPEELGGLGLPLTEETVKLITKEGRAIATYLSTRPDPKDVSIFAPRLAADSTKACRAWMRACDMINEIDGYEYRWLDEDEETRTPPVPLRHFVGLGSKPVESESRDRYNEVRRLALITKLNPMTNKKLLEFAARPRVAGWVRPRIAGDVGDDE
jgi:hypothetical protein